MIGVTGKRSAIAQAFSQSIAERDIVYGSTSTLPHDLDEYLLCAGVLVGKNAEAISNEEAFETFKVNFIDVIRFCEAVFSKNDHARICILGSESGIKGSYDMVYAGSKAALHLYIETKKLTHPGQHLVGLAPTIIEDSGMTQRRKDLETVLERGKARRLGRWLTAEEVARMAHVALKESALCNTVIRMPGGTW